MTQSLKVDAAKHKKIMKKWKKSVLQERAREYGLDITDADTKDVLIKKILPYRMTESCKESMTASNQALTVDAAKHENTMDYILNHPDAGKIEKMKNWERPVLQDRARGYGLSTVGNKDDLIEKILVFENGIDPSTSMPISRRNGGKSKRRRKRRRKHTRKRRRKHTRKRR